MRQIKIKLSKTIFLLLAIQVNSCGESKQVTHVTPVEKNITETVPLLYEPPAKTKEEIFKEITELVTSDPECSWGGLTNSYKNCVKEDLRFAPATGTAISLGKRILILDGEKKPHFYSSFFHYKNRILGYYQLGQQLYGGYYEFIPQIRAPKLLSYVDKVLSTARFPFLSEDLTPVGLPILSLHGQIISLQPNERELAPHGEHIFELLADYVPDAQFIVADLFRGPTGFEIITIIKRRDRVLARFSR